MQNKYNKINLYIHDIVIVYNDIQLTTFFVLVQPRLVSEPSVEASSRSLEVSWPTWPVGHGGDGPVPLWERYTHFKLS